MISLILVVVSVLFLIGLFGNVASYLILIGLGFMGLAYLVVYIGAISILFLFILMLINIRISELQSNTRNTIPLAILFSVFLNFILIEFIPFGTSNLIDTSFTEKVLHGLGEGSNKFYLNYVNINLDSLNNHQCSFVTSNMWDGNLAENSHITSIGNVLYTNYSMWLLIASFILLLAMVGTIVIVMKPSASAGGVDNSGLTRSGSLSKG
nr:NADH dehydrogenase subunit 6 [Valsa mali var. pyri (nom. inval.)]